MLPEALRAYPRYAAAAEGSPEREAARRAMYAAGFEPGSEFLWPIYSSIYWDLTQRIYREELDPAYDGSTLAGTPGCTTGGPAGSSTACDAQYDLAFRPAAVREAFEGLELTGKLKRPMLTLQGDLDSLITRERHGDRYRELVEQAHRARLHRYYVIEGGQHVDAFYDLFPDRLRPILPCYRTAFDALTAWVERGEQPPASGVVERGSGDLVNTCRLE